MIAWGAADLADSLQIGFSARIDSRGMRSAIALSFATHRQLGYWSSNYDLWTHALAVTDRNFIAQDNLGGALLLLGKPDEAYPHFQAAAEINPNDPMSHSNLGAYLQEHGKLPEAMEQYDRDHQSDFRCRIAGGDLRQPGRSVSQARRRRKSPRQLRPGSAAESATSPTPILGLGSCWKNKISWMKPSATIQNRSSCARPIRDFCFWAMLSRAQAAARKRWQPTRPP